MKALGAPEASHKLVFRIGACPPAKGEIDLYDAMKASGLSDRDCVLALLRKGSRQIEQLANMSRSSAAKLVYEPGGIAIETNRSIAAGKIERLKAIIDPFDAMTPRAFGLKVGQAIVVLASKDYAAV